MTGGFEQIFGGSSDLIVSEPSQQFGFLQLRKNHQMKLFMQWTTASCPMVQMS